MDLIALFKNKKFIIAIILILTIPIWLPILSYIFEFIIQAGRIMGTYIRLIGSGTICI
ncbi:MAG: hypothetical protein IJY25_00700 [Bacilli bacterium]|nr:hypothetical protein [Bacilli bacterium]